jgi:hypothetical protein
MNYDEAVGRLTALGDAPDPDLLDRTVEPLESAMRTDDPEGYAWFVVAVCDQLNSRDLGDWRRQDKRFRRIDRRSGPVIVWVSSLFGEDQQVERRYNKRTKILCCRSRPRMSQDKVNDGKMQLGAHGSGGIYLMTSAISPLAGSASCILRSAV